MNLLSALVVAKAVNSGLVDVSTSVMQGHVGFCATSDDGIPRAGCYGIRRILEPTPEI